MENTKIGDITIIHSDLVSPNIFGEQNVVYKMSYSDGKFYIGKTKDLGERLKQHCLIQTETRNSSHLHLMKWTEVEVLGQASTMEELAQMEKQCIHTELMKLSRMTNIPLAELPSDMVHQTMLNEILYR
jgi:predicted GIY-YIG superfamily endonuclease